MKSNVTLSMPQIANKPNRSMFAVLKTSLATVALATSQLVFAADCNVNVIEEWDAGYKAEISIVNNGDAFSSWNLSWELAQGDSFNSGWNATLSCVATSCSATPPSWNPLIANGGSYTFGFIVNKGNSAASEPLVINGDVCDGTTLVSNVVNNNDVLWNLDGDSSQIQYVSMKKDHTAEINTFFASSGDPALSGSIDSSGEAIFAIDLNDVDTGVDIRNSRLLSILFETDLLPTAYFRSQLDLSIVNDLAVGDVLRTTLDGELSLHAIRQDISADVMIVKTSATELNVSTVKPVTISSSSFDMSAGIEALRVVANLSSIGESVPVYFQLSYLANTNSATQPVDMPDAPEDPDSLVGAFDDVNVVTTLDWQDNSDNETLYLVRRKSTDGYWQTTAELSSNVTDFTQGLPDTGEYDYKVIAVNNGVPSLATNIETITVTEGNQLAKGTQIYADQCSTCHGTSGEGIGSFPALNIERDIESMIDYIADYMPLSDPASCDRQCAEDVAAFIETLWESEIVCDLGLTPVSYGARQLKILTRDEYQNSVEDLIGIDYKVADGLSEDTKVGFFANNTHAAVTATSYSNHLLVAEEISLWSADRDFAPALSCASYDQDCADLFIDTVAPKIFRRPLTGIEITDFGAMANGSYTSGDVKAGIQMSLEALLSSPQFLYRHELGESNPGNPELDSDAFELTSYEMATFLAYTFLGSTPDQELLDAAERDELRTEAEIMSQAQRLAGDAKGVMSAFVGSWLGTEDLGLAAKDSSVWPGFDDLVPHMQNEINETFSYIMTEPTEQFSSLYAGNFTFLNDTLAAHYNLSGSLGSELQRVITPGRGGILANGGFMARWGESIESSPIRRSVKVRRRMLCQDQPDPPAGTFAAREEKLQELSDLLQDPTTTNRLKYHRLTEDVPCTTCHLEYINPLGFGMEDFDTVGRVRTSDLNGNSIDASGELFAPNRYFDVSEVESFQGTLGLGSVLSQLPSAQACLPKQMFRYFIGVGHDSVDPNNPESVSLSDEEQSGYSCEIDRLTDSMMNGSPRSMLESFAALKAVRYRKAWVRD